MSRELLEEVARLADRLSPEEKRSLVTYLNSSRNIEQPQQSPARLCGESGVISFRKTSISMRPSMKFAGNGRKNGLRCSTDDSVFGGHPCALLVSHRFSAPVSSSF